jgi:hypothetical protein
MHQAIRSVGRSSSEDFTIALHDYLAQQYYICVSQDAFFDAHEFSRTISSAARKAIAFPAIITHMCTVREKLFGGEATLMSIGFSDDERQNIDAIVEW